MGKKKNKNMVKMMMVIDYGNKGTKR